MACGDLNLDSVLDCQVPFQGGVGQQSRLVLVLKEDVLSMTTTGLDVISAITLAANKAMFRYDGFKQSLKPKYSRVTSPSGQSMYIHQADFFIYDYSQAMKTNLQRMNNGRYIAIFENAKQDANTFEILGKTVGMELFVSERAPGENGGAFKLQLKTPDNEFEGAFPQTLFATDYPTTLALINGYLYLPTITSFAPATFTSGAGGSPVITGTNFYANGTNSAVLKIEAINQATLAVTPANSFTVTAAVTCTPTFSGGALPAGNYKLRVTTTKGQVTSVLNLIVT